MNRVLAAAVGLVVLAGLAYGADPQPWGRTGDRTLDSVLEQLNTQASVDPDGFIRQLSARHSVPERDIRQAQETYGFGAADIFMATALAQATHRPVVSVAEEYQKNQGKGWGVIAKDMGIKPGSREFKQLKSGARGSLDRLRADSRNKQKHDRELKRQHESQTKKDAQNQGRAHSH